MIRVEASLTSTRDFRCTCCVQKVCVRTTQVPPQRVSFPALKDSFTLAGSNPAEELWSLVEALGSRPEAASKFASLLQLACAAAGSSEGPGASRWAAMLKQEKQLALLSTEGTMDFGATVEVQVEACMI